MTDISLEIKPGEKVCLVGRPGSGVNHFMLTMLGEAILNKGTLKINGKLSYLSSNHEVLIEGTIKENILMEEKYDPKKFLKVIEVVELNLTKFPAGGEMEIYHNACNISTDERKKILLARTLYHDGDIICLENFFDDWYVNLSERIFKKIMIHLDKKTVIYSTSHNILMKQSDMVLYFDKGEIVRQGRYVDLLCEHTGPFFELIIGEKKRNWRRQVIGKLLEGIKMKTNKEEPSKIKEIE